MKTLLGLLIVSNAALFLFGAVQHVGISIGPFREPQIIPAAIVEAVCGLFLAWGAFAVFGYPVASWRVVWIANLVALGGVLLGIAALALGAGPRTTSNDLHHRIMLALAGISLLILSFGRSALNGKSR